MTTATKKTTAKKTAKKAPAKKTAASKSGNPAVRAQAEAQAAAAAAALIPSSPSSASDFKARKRGKLLPLPSGLVVRARRVGIEDFILKAKSSSVPNPLLEIVSETLEKGQKADPNKMMGGEEDEVDLEMIAEMMKMVDAIIMESVVEPRIHPSLDEDGEEIPEVDRDDDLVYIDDLDGEDKMFLFQWNTGGTEDIASFREEAGASLASLAASKGGAN